MLQHLVSGHRRCGGLNIGNGKDKGGPLPPFIAFFVKSFLTVKSALKNKFYINDKHLRSIKALARWKHESRVEDASRAVLVPTAGVVSAEVYLNYRRVSLDGGRTASNNPFRCKACTCKSNILRELEDFNNCRSPNFACCFIGVKRHQMCFLMTFMWGPWSENIR